MLLCGGLHVSTSCYAFGVCTETLSLQQDLYTTADQNLNITKSHFGSESHSVYISLEIILC